MENSRSRDQSKKRKWTRHTPTSIMMSIRVPVDLADWLREFVDSHGESASACMVEGLRMFRKAMTDPEWNREFIERTSRKGGKTE